MKESNDSFAFLILHLTVFLWGITAILGKLISYGSFELVWHRTLISTIVYCLIPGTIKQIRSCSYEVIGRFVCIGLSQSLHWVCFYSSIKLGNSASITLACLALISFFLTLLEPIIIGSKFSIRNAFLGFVVVVGVLFIYVSLPSEPLATFSMTDDKPNTQAAIVVGIFAAFLQAITTVFNKKHIKEAPILAISTIQVGSGALILSIIVPIIHGKNTIFYPILDIENKNYDLMWILILTVLCTNLTFYMQNWCLTKLSAFTTVLATNLEPVYGIILGAIIFHEHRSLNLQFYTGASVIIFAVIAGPLVDYIEDNHCKKVGYTKILDSNVQFKSSHNKISNNNLTDLEDQINK